METEYFSSVKRPNSFIEQIVWTARLVRKCGNGS